MYHVAICWHMCNTILNNYSKAKSDIVKYTAPVINKRVAKF